MNSQARAFTDRFTKEIGRPTRSGSLSTRQSNRAHQGLDLPIMQKATVRPKTLISHDFWPLGLRLGTRTGGGSLWLFVMIMPLHVRSQHMLSGHGRSLGNICLALVSRHCLLSRDVGEVPTPDLSDDAQDLHHQLTACGRKQEDPLTANPHHGKLEPLAHLSQRQRALASPQVQRISR
jgi:hypothetical protein